MRRFLVALTMLAALPAAGMAGPAAAEVGMRTMTYPDPAHGGTGRMNVWYPTTAPEQPVRRGPFTLSVAEGAPAVEGRHPLVMVSHGSGGSALGHVDTTMALARAGYVVAAVHHVGNSFDDDRDARSAILWRNRPAQFSAALDLVLADPDIGTHVDGSRIGALGMSAGGYTVLVAAGGVADLGIIADYCTRHPRDPAFCRDGVPHWTGTVDAPDPRIRAVVAMVPASAMFGDGAFARVSVPIRLYDAEADVILGDTQVKEVRDRLPPTSEYTLVAGAGHFSFMVPYPAEMAADIGLPAQDPPGFDRAAFHERLNREVVDFFDRNLAVARNGP
jgi:Predicted dienelactone hydrolase